MTTRKTHATAATTQNQPATPAPSPAPAEASPAPTPPPDPNTALEAYVQQTVTDLDNVEAGLGGDPPLTPVQKRHAAKLRKGGEKVVAQIGDLATQHQLESPALQVSVMLALMGRAQALQPLADRLAAFAKHVADVIFSAQSAAWVMAMQYYALLQRRAAADAELAKALQPIAQVFAYRHPSTKAPVGSPTKRQRQAVAKAKKTLKTVAGGKLAGPAPATATETTSAPSATTASPAQANGNAASPPATAPVPTNGSPASPTHS